MNGGGDGLSDIWCVVLDYGKGSPMAADVVSLNKNVIDAYLGVAHD